MISASISARRTPPAPIVALLRPSSRQPSRRPVPMEPALGDKSRDKAEKAANTVASRVVLCADTTAWLLEQPSLPSVITSLPDITELAGLDFESRHGVADYSAWFRNTVAQIVGKLRPDAVAVFYQTDTHAHGSYVSKSFLCSAGALDAGGAMLFHKDVGQLRFGKMPTYTHLLAYAGPHSALDLHRLHHFNCSALPDVAPRGDVAWVRGMGVEAALGACRFVRDVVGGAEVCDPYCGSGTVLAAANSLGLAAVGVELSSKRARHARVMALEREACGTLVARRTTDLVDRGFKSTGEFKPGAAAGAAGDDGAGGEGTREQLLGGGGVDDGEDDGGEWEKGGVGSA